MNKEKTIFSRVLLYEQEDVQYSPDWELDLRANCTVWACSWMIEGMQHPITTRAKINVISKAKSNNFEPVSCLIEQYREGYWNIFDEIFLTQDTYKDSESLKNEALYRMECFLMGIPLEMVKEKYGVLEQKEEEEVEELDGGKNIISFSPRNKS
tara:strand:- start:42 stop:503 length:462 start_codon:yes stop_codon:yes gene_type:complete